MSITIESHLISCELLFKYSSRNSFLAPSLAPELGCGHNCLRLPLATALTLVILTSLNKHFQLLLSTCWEHVVPLAMCPSIALRIRTWWQPPVRRPRWGMNGVVRLCRGSMRRLMLHSLWGPAALWRRCRRAAAADCYGGKRGTLKYHPEEN